MSLPSTVAIRMLPPLWLGMVVAISAIETPQKFQAPGITLELGLGIGREVFHALNAVELVLAAVLAAALVHRRRRISALLRVLVAIAILALAVQVFALRPALDERLAARLAGDALGDSWHHLGYIGLEVVKALALATTAILVAKETT